MKKSLSSTGFLLLLLCSAVTHAETIDAKISAISAAPASERVALMNALKVEIAQMNAQDRAVALAQFKSDRDNAQSNTIRQTMQNRMQQMNTQETSTTSGSNLQNFQNNPPRIGGRR